MFKNSIAKLLTLLLAMALSIPSALARPTSESATVFPIVEPAPVAQDPEIVLSSPSLILVTDSTFNPMDLRSIAGLAYDFDPPYIVALISLFASVSVTWCFVIGPNAFGFTYPIPLPTGQVEIGWGLGGDALFGAYSLGPYYYFQIVGEFGIYAVDFNGNSSFAVAPVFLLNVG